MKITVKPADNKRVLKPEGDFFESNIWIEVESTSYIRRRLKDGDLMSKPQNENAGKVEQNRKYTGKGDKTNG